MPKAYVFTRYGGPETEALIEVDRPRPGPGRLLVAVRAPGVNPVDWKQRTGYRRPGETSERTFPSVLGNEVAGVVEDTGEGVTEFAPGDEVFGTALAGGYAEFALLPVGITARKPAELSFVAAATLPVAAATAYDGIQQLGLPTGSMLLITGAGGGVGVAAVQIARATGLRVVGVSSAAKKDFVELLGAAHVPSGEGWAERARAAAPDGIDGVYDLVPRQAAFAREGAASWGSPRSSEAGSGGACSRRAGRKAPSTGRTYSGFRPVRRECVPGVATGRTSPVGAPVGGEVLTDAAALLTDRTALITAAAPPEDVARLGGARVTRLRNAAVLAAVARLVVSGDLDPHVTRTFPLERAGEALREVEDGHAKGKVVIEVAV